MLLGKILWKAPIRSISPSRRVSKQQFFTLMSEKAMVITEVNMAFFIAAGLTALL